MSTQFDIISPVDGAVYATCTYATPAELDRSVELARAAIPVWAATPFDTRAELVGRLIDEMVARKDTLAKHVTMQMGRPAWQADESGRLALQAKKLVDQAREALQNDPVDQDPDVRRVIEHVPLGLCFSICAWNYPVAMLNSLAVAPLLMGNVVLLKHAPQTALIGDVLTEAAIAAGLPEGVLTALNITHPDAEKLIGSGKVDMVQFIGSARGGHAVYDAGRGTFTRYGLELGGKDAVYIRADSPIEPIIADLLEGSFGNAGQSCCSVERLYVNRAIYPAFVDAFVAAAESVDLGHPITDRPFIGPLVSAQAATRIRGLLDDAVAKGARAALPTGRFAAEDLGPAYMAPQVMLDVNHSMALMHEETFGPVVPIMAVEDDEQAVALMNDASYGLTAAIFSSDLDAATALGRRVESGTFYVNRCDHADMNLPWGGVKQSGVGRSYALEGLRELVTTRSWHIRTLES